VFTFAVFGAALGDGLNRQAAAQIHLARMGTLI
jgi:hypothetical protein